VKTAYLIVPGLQHPETFLWRNASPILAQPQLWEAMRTVAVGLLFRIRTEQNVGGTLRAEDRIESAIGLIDSTSRWRASLGIIRTALTAIRIKEVAEASWAVFNMMVNKHPASVPMQERQQLAQALRTAVEKLPADDPRSTFEAAIAAMMVRLAFAENDVEVAHIVPFSPIYTVNAGNYVEDREATVDVLASSMLFCESFGRLCEKAPEYLFLPLPTTTSLAAALEERPEEKPPAPTTRERAKKPPVEEPAEED